jgi:heterokaryon incompatibility protein (HET)
MRLLKINNDGSFSLHTSSRPTTPYAILSHTWGNDDEEVTFKDIMNGTGGNKAGYQKLRFCGKQAQADNLEYFWIDTCCINKDSSTELSESINSMFRFYQGAERCYVYLSDVSGHGTHAERESQFRKSRWFTRGWTLQELLAPKVVEFYSWNHDLLGDKGSLEQQIHEITGIATEALRGHGLQYFSIQERFKWVEKRVTTKEEDLMYCLLGIFNVYLPLIYGEGRKHAMDRLRRKITEVEPQSFGKLCDSSYLALLNVLLFLREIGQKRIISLSMLIFYKDSISKSCSGSISDQGPHQSWRYK